MFSPLDFSHANHLLLLLLRIKVLRQGKMKWYSSLVVILLVHTEGASTQPHHYLRSGENEGSNIHRKLAWQPWDKPKVKMCQLLSSDPVKFRDVKVKKNKVLPLQARGAHFRGTCKENCSKMCPESACDLDNGRCKGMCTPPDPPCVDGETCECLCEDFRRSLKFPPNKVNMCRIDQTTNPITFSTVSVRRGKVGNRLQDGYLLQSCRKHTCEEICGSGIDCDKSAGECMSDNVEQVPQCLAATTTTCPGQQCVCECV